MLLRAFAATGTLWIGRKGCRKASGRTHRHDDRAGFLGMLSLRRRAPTTLKQIASLRCHRRLFFWIIS